MRESGQDSNMNVSRGEHQSKTKASFRGKQEQRQDGDALPLIACWPLQEFALVTTIIAGAHLYPRLPSSVLIYLLVITALAQHTGRLLLSWRPCWPASPLTTLHFPLYEFAFLSSLSDDLLDPWVFLAMAIIIGS